MTKDDVVDICRVQYSEPEFIVRSPGRANLIGEHTDYNDGFVLPFAVSKSIYFAALKNGSQQYSITAGNLRNTEILDLNNKDSASFSRYFISVLNIVMKHGYQVGGLDIVFGGDLPIGAGLSSSSSITCGFLKVLDVAFQLNIDQSAMLKLAVEAEHGVGVEGGIMDQFSIIYGLKDQLILLDCFNHSYQHIDFLFDDCSLIIFNTNVSHNLANTEYNKRARTCKAALETIKQNAPSVGGFRDVNMDHLQHLEGIAYNRLKHVVEENLRVLHSIESLKRLEKEKLGKLINASHESLRHLFEVSCDELDFIAENLQKDPQVLGARMMGGGFGGAVISLIDKERIDLGFNHLKEKYKAQFDKDLSFFEIKPEQGLEVLSSVSEVIN